MAALAEPTPTPRSRPRYVAPALPHRAAVYTRVSSKKQGEDDKTSLETQEKNCRWLAAADGVPVGTELVILDKHTGEELHERPGLTRLREAAKRHEFSHLYVNSTDRLSRDPLHLGIVVEEMQRVGVAVKFVTEPLDDSPEGQIIRYLHGWRSKMDNAKRREATMRGVRGRVDRGKYLPGKRPPYGYTFGPERDKEGKLTKERLEANPATWPIVERIWREGLAGRTIRAIALGLTTDHIPSPTGGAQWDPGTVRYILTNPLYWGQPTALRRMLVPVGLAVRAHYAHKSKAVTRPVDDQVELPAKIAPAVVSPEVAARVQARLQMNKQLATPQNPNAQELLRGIARCGYCQNGLLVARYLGRPSEASRHMRSRARTIYRCRKGNKLQGFPNGCQHHGIEGHKLDAAVWSAVKDVLTHPELIAQELERMRASEDPAADTLAAIDSQIADLRRRIKNKRAYAEGVDDARERAEVAAEVKALRTQEDQLEAERTATQAHYADWREQQEGLARTLDWCARVGENLDAMTLDERRETLITLKADVLLYRADHTPRAELTIHLPLSGARTLDLSGLMRVHGDEHDLMCWRLTR